jgi:hypothetical protein
MKRREFFRKSVGAGGCCGSCNQSGGYQNLWAGSPAAKAKYDMVAVMGGLPEAMFDLGIQELGGMGAFVAKGQRCL